MMMVIDAKDHSHAIAGAKAKAMIYDDNEKL
jgi:hypothetical protein